MPELWTTTEVADRYGIKVESVPSSMRRLGVPVHSREAGRKGQNKYDAALVCAAREKMAGQGFRSDLNSTPKENNAHG